MNEETIRKKLTEAMWGGFYHCPNSNAVVPLLQGDDKVLCPCGKVNPAIPREAPGVHIARFLKAATVDDFMTYEFERRGGK